MGNQTMGEIISTLRKEKGMTQKELADRLGLTDKAVSKWERDGAYPDVGTLPQLAELLDVSVDELLSAPHRGKRVSKREELLDLILKAVPLAMGTAVTVLGALGELTADAGLGMLGIGLAGVGIFL